MYIEIKPCYSVLCYSIQENEVVSNELCIWLCVLLLVTHIWILSGLRNFFLRIGLSYQQVLSWQQAADRHARLVIDVYLHWILQIGWEGKGGCWSIMIRMDQNTVFETAKLNKYFITISQNFSAFYSSCDWSIGDGTIWYKKVGKFLM